MGDEYDSSVDVSDVDTSSDSSADYSADTPSEDYSDSIDDFSEDTSSDDYGEIADEIPDEITEDTYDESVTDLSDDSLDVPEDIEEDISLESSEDTTEDIPEDILEDTEEEIVEDNQESTDDSFDDIPEDTESDETEVEVSSDIPEEIEEDVEPEVTDEFMEEADVVDETDDVEPNDDLTEQETEAVDETTEIEPAEEVAEEDAGVVDGTAETKIVDETAEAEAADEPVEEEAEVVDETAEVETTEELAEEEAEIVDEIDEVEPTDELAEEEAEVADETAEAEHTDEPVEEETEVVDETAEAEPTDALMVEEPEIIDKTVETEADDELAEEAIVVDKSPEAETAEENKELPFDNTVALNADSNEIPQQTASWRDNVKKANPIKAAGIAAYMGAALKADEAGYKTVRGYATGIGGGLAVKAAGKLGHLPSDVEAGHADSVKSASHLYDEMYAAKHPEAVLNFKPSPVPQEIVEKNTLVLDENPYASSIEMPDFSIETQPTERSIPGTPGVVNVKVNSEGKTVGNSSELSKNLWKSFEDVPLASYDSAGDLPQKAKGYQAQHIIPVEMHNHPVLQKIGMDMNDASNGMFLPEPDGDVHALTTHKGYHAVYNKVCEEYLDKIYEKHGDDASVEAVEADVAKLQRGLKSVLEDGVPIYRRKANADQLDVSDRGGGATEDLLRKAIDKKLKI